MDEPQVSEGIAAEAAELETLYRTTDLPLYGLPQSYLGLRMIGDAYRAHERDGPEGPRVLTGEGFGLAHGDPLTPGSPTLQVITSRGVPPPPGDLLSAEGLRAGSDLDVSESRQFTATVSLEGERVAFEGIRVSNAWVLQASIEGHAVTVIGIQFALDEVRLVRVRDVAPYIAGRRAYVGSKIQRRDQS